MARYFFYSIFLLFGNLLFINDNTFAKSFPEHFTQEINNEVILSDILSDNFMDEVDKDSSESIIFPFYLKTNNQIKRKLLVNIRENIYSTYLLLNVYIDLPPPNFS